MEEIRKLNACIGIPDTLKEAGMPEDKFLAGLRETSEAALGDPCTGTNPRKPTVEEIMEIYRAAYFGREFLVYMPLIPVSLFSARKSRINQPEVEDYGPGCSGNSGV